MDPDIAVALEVMAKGMAGIFIALSILYGFVIGLIKIFPEDPKEVESDEE